MKKKKWFKSIFETRNYKGLESKDTNNKLTPHRGMVMMKINFQVSQLTTNDPQVIIRRIQLKLKEKKYDILEVTDNSVKFYDDPWVLRWTHQQAMRLDGGSFKINDTSIALNYYLNLWPPLIGVSIPVIGTVLAGAYDGTIFFMTFIIIALCVQTVISKNVAKDMLTGILSNDAMV